MTAPRRFLGLASLSGTIWVGAGSALLGVSGYAFLTLTARVVPDYAGVAALYLLVALAGPALFIPIEQETTRLVSRAGALNQGIRVVIRQLALTSAAMAAVALVVLLALGPLLVSRVFEGSWGLLIALMISVAGYGGACLVRGVFAGQHRLREYAICVGVDGLMRLIPCVALAIAGVSSPLPYGFALGLGSVAALAVGLIWFRGARPASAIVEARPASAIVEARPASAIIEARPASAIADVGPAVPWRELLTAVGWLVAAWGASFALANIAPVIVTALLPDDRGRAGVFAYAFVVARVPVFVLLSLQAILLPALSRSAAKRDVAGLRRGIRQALIVVAALGVAALALTAPVSRWLVGVLFGASASISAWTITLLAVGTILAMLVQVLQPALIAVAGHRVVAAAWVAGVVVFAAAFALPVDAVTAATIAQVVSGVATVAVMGVALLRHLRRPSATVTPTQVAV